MNHAEGPYIQIGRCHHFTHVGQALQHLFDAVLAQRLVRRLCTACREPRVADDEMLAGLASQYLESGTHNTAEARQAQIGRWRQQYGSAQGELRMWRPVGCAKCEGHGYHGRLGIHELMMSDETIRQHIRHRARPRTSGTPRSPPTCSPCARTASKRCCRA